MGLLTPPLLDWVMDRDIRSTCSRFGQFSHVGGKLFIVHGELEIVPRIVFAYSKIVYDTYYLSFVVKMINLIFERNCKSYILNTHQNVIGFIND